MYVGRCGVGGVESQPTFLVSRGFAPANWILTKRQAHWCAKAAKHSANHFQKRTPQIHYLSMYVCRYIFFRNNPHQKHCWIRIRGRGPGASKYEARRAGDEMCLVRRPRALPGGGGGGVCLFITRMRPIRSWRGCVQSVSCPLSVHAHSRVRHTLIRDNTVVHNHVEFPVLEL